MKADLVVFDATSPAMVAAAQENPVAAIVLHSSERDIDAVIVDGVVRKEAGRLLGVRVSETPGLANSAVRAGQNFAWKEVVQAVLKSRAGLKKKLEGIDMKAAEEVVMNAFHMDRAALAD